MHFYWELYCKCTVHLVTIPPPDFGGHEFRFDPPLAGAARPHAAAAAAHPHAAVATAADEGDGGGNGNRQKLFHQDPSSKICRDYGMDIRIYYDLLYRYVSRAK